MVASLRELAVELGRTPTIAEFESGTGMGNGLIYRYFGNYSAFTQAAELDPPKRGKKVTNEIFVADVKEQIETHVHKPRLEKVEYTETLFIGDSHFPFVHKPTLEKIYRLTEILKPKRIIQMGDLYDMYAHSKFPKSLNIYTPDQEESQGRIMAEAMWQELQRLNPKAEFYQIMGNHDIRPVRRVLESAPSLERAIINHVKDLMTFEGVTTIADSRQELILDGVQILHGYRTRLGAHRDYTFMNTVVAHTHKGGTVYRHFNGQIFWELNAGFVGDAESKALGYTPQRIHDCTLGIGWLDKFGPRFIPL